MWGFLATPKSAGGLFVLGLAIGADVGLVLAVGGAAEVVALVVVQVGVLAGVALLFMGRRDWKEAQSATRSALMDVHRRELAEYADQMQLWLGQAETPWRTGPVMYQFQQHYPDLTTPIDTWLRMARAEKANPNWRPVPTLMQQRAAAQIGLGSVASGHIRGSCARCREIEGAPQPSKETISSIRQT